jgi:hypothetical protein
MDVQRIQDCCEETVRHAGHGYPLLALKHLSPHLLPKPVHPGQPPATKKYLRLFQRFATFVFRVFRVPSGPRRWLTGIRFTQLQLE